MSCEERERYDAYLICQHRGHQPDGFVTASIPPKQRCKWCRTYFWTEVRTTERESGAPEAYLTPEQEASLQSHGLAHKPHEFEGRHDRWCEVCQLPDRHPVHRKENRDELR